MVMTIFWLVREKKEQKIIFRIDAESVFGLEVRRQNDQTNDLDATGGVDGQVIIDTPDTDITQGILEAPEKVVEAERTDE